MSSLNASRRSQRSPYETLFVPENDCYGTKVEWIKEKVRRSTSRLAFAQRYYGSTYRHERVERCPCCLSADLKPHLRTFKNWVQIRLSQCQSCGLILQNPRLNETSLKLFYEKDFRGSSRDDAHSRQFERSRRRGEYQKQFIFEKIQMDRPMKVLEIGSSNGGTLQVFQDLGHQVQGCELDPTCCRFANQQGIPTVQDFEEIPPGPYDLILMSHVLEHLPDPVKQLRWLRDRLHSKGSIYIEVPGASDPARFRRSVQLAHLWYFEGKTLSELCERAQLQCLRLNEVVQGLFQKTSEETSSLQKRSN